MANKCARLPFSFRVPLISVVIVLLVACNVAQAEVRPEFSGSWYNPAQSGHGFSIEVISPTLSIVYWYTYDPFGNPIFLFGNGRNVGDRIEADVYFFQGMQFGEFDPNTNERFDWGTLSVTFHDCNRATLSYESSLSYQSGESFDSGQISLYRLASIEGFKCSNNPTAGLYSGFAYSARDYQTYSGYGVLNEQGIFHFVSEDGVIVKGRMSNTSASKGSFSASGSSVFFNAGVSYQSGSFSATGHFNPDMIGANYSIPGTSERGWLEVHKLSRWTNTGVSLSDISGTWQAYNYMTGLSAPVSISSNGNISATDSYGCRYSGRFEIPNPELNVLAVTVTVTGCSVLSGTFTGSGGYFENENVYFSGYDAILAIGWSSSNDAAAMRLTRR